MTQNKYIILDRDGVINHDSSNYIKCADEWDPIPRSLDAIGLLTKHDYKILLISNQSAISRHLMDFNDFLGIHKKLLENAQNTLEESILHITVLTIQIVTRCIGSLNLECI